MPLSGGSARQCFHAGYDHLLMALGQSTNPAALASLVTPEIEQLVDLLNRKAQGSGSLDEAQLMYVASQTEHSKGCFNVALAGVFETLRNFQISKGSDRRLGDNRLESNGHRNFVSRSFKKRRAHATA